MTTLKRRRLEMGYSSAEAAAIQAGIAATTWWRYEAGEPVLRLETARAIARVLCCEVAAVIEPPPWLQPQPEPAPARRYVHIRLAA